MELSGVFIFALSPECWGKYLGIALYRQKGQCNKMITECGGKVAWFNQLTVPALLGKSRRLKHKTQKLKTPLFPEDGGVVTIDLCIT